MIFTNLWDQRKFRGDCEMFMAFFSLFKPFLWFSVLSAKVNLRKWVIFTFQKSTPATSDWQNHLEFDISILVSYWRVISIWIDIRGYFEQKYRSYRENLIKNRNVRIFLGRLFFLLLIEYKKSTLKSGTIWFHETTNNSTGLKCQMFMEIFFTHRLALRQQCWKIVEVMNSYKCSRLSIFIKHYIDIRHQ